MYCSQREGGRERERGRKRERGRERERERKREREREREGERREREGGVVCCAVGSPVVEEGGTLAKPAAAKQLPRLKVEASLANIRVAIVEDVDDPQALTLRVGYRGN